MRDSRRIRVLLHSLAGSLVVLTSILADQILGQPRAWGLLQYLGLMTGLGIVAIGFVGLRAGIVPRISTNLCLALVCLFLFLAAGEGFFRAIGFDFANEARAWRRVPPYYRQPIVPTGDVFFRRPGPEQWTGQVLNTRLKQLGILPNPYTNEPVITVEYDRNGFRNPDHMSDWEIAVAGDSFTELGYLAHDQLFTSVLARGLNLSVLNLGVSYTGPLAQLSYLNDYGMAASTKHTFIMFFEGNDLRNLAAEYEAVVRWRETGRRDYRKFSEQRSLVRALYEVAGQAKRRLLYRGTSTPAAASFKSSHGHIPVTLNCTPPGRVQLSKETLFQLNYFFRQYADFGRNRRVTTWLAYLPCVRRVLHGQLEFSASAPEATRNWQPTDLPEVVSELCDQYGIKFIDLTPSLVRETNRNKELLYNPSYDTHLNATGSQVVGRELACHFLRQSMIARQGAAIDCS